MAIRSGFLVLPDDENLLEACVDFTSSPDEGRIQARGSKMG